MLVSPSKLMKRYELRAVAVRVPPAPLLGLLDRLQQCLPRGTVLDAVEQ